MTTQNTAISENTPVNGVDVDQVMNTIGLVAQDIDNAQFQFRSKNRWINGSLNRSSIKGLFAIGREDFSRPEAFEVDADQPLFLAGHDTAPNPVEYLLHSLASCLTTTMVYHASVQGIEIGSVNSSLEGDIDVRGFFGLSDEVTRGFNKVRVHMQVNSPASAEELTALAMYSPVYDVVSKSLPVEFVLEKV